MRFSLTKAALALAALGTAIAQGPSSSGPNASSASSTPRPSSSGSANTNQTVLTTTITSFLPQGSGQSSAVPLTLTLTLNSTSPQAINETIANATMSGNDTLANGTMEWQEGDDWIPFNIIIDPAYGVLGALLILSGIPLAVLGGKNRWSSLAITTGYALMVFTLVMILALGVSPALQPPSPKPPTQLLRGLYLLACVLSAFVGAGLGVFLYKLAKYWVNAAGGFALAWYILALRPGGTIENVIGRWGLIGGMSVGAFIAGLPNPLNPYLVLLSTAWIGATAFILGVDCFTRAGLKEFYVYNLGFWNLFPKLNGKKYPLTQTMAIELGILAAVFLIGAAIQFRILNILQKRMKRMQEEEEARVDAEEVGKAAERFKNVEAEHAEWEEKYGSTSGGGGPSSSASGLGHKGDHSLDTPGAVDLPELQFSRDSNDKRFSSTHSLLSQTERQRYEAVGQVSPTNDAFPPQSQYQAQRNRSRTRLNEMDTDHAEELVGDGDDKADPALEEQMKLLEEVKKARLEVRSSLDKLRSSTPTALSPRDGTHSGGSTPTMDRFATGHTRQLSNASSNMLGRPVSILQRASPTSPGFPPINTAPSDQLVPPKSEWEQYVSSRNIVSPAPVASGAPSMYRQSSYDGYGYAQGGIAAGSRPGSAMGMEFGGPQDIPLRERRQSSQTMPIAMARPSSNYDLRRPTSQYDLNRPVSQHETPVQQQRASYAPGTIIGSAAGAKYTAVTPGAGMTDGYAGRPAAVPRAMTYEELSDRHRKRMTQMQNPVSSKMNEEIELAAAKEKWEKQRRQERELMRRREAEKMQLVKEREQEAADAGRQGGMRGGGQRGKGEVMKSTDEWRRSVAGNLEQYAPQQQLVHASSSGQIRGPGHGEVPRSPQRAARQQEEIKYGTAGRRRQSSHIAN